MARMPLSKRQRAIVLLIYTIRLRDLMMMLLFSYFIIVLELVKTTRKKNIHSAKRSLIRGMKNVNEFLRDELSCFDQLRMDKSTFHKLCELLKDYGGVKESKNMFLEERVAIFLNILGHDQKQRTIVRRLRNFQESTQRRWTSEEDELLVKFLMEMHIEGKWKAESGFRSGYLAHLEKLFAASMPEAEFKVSNIDSRLSYLRKRFNALQDIKQKGSGFGWDDNQKMVTGDRKLFDGWVKSHKEAKGMYRKPFPFYDDLEVIYSKDRATGLKAFVPADKDDEEANQDNIQEDIQEITSSKGEDVPSEVSGTNKRVVDESSSKIPAKKKARKNKEIQSMQKSLENMMEKMIENSNVQIEKLASMIEGPKNVKSGLREDLGKVPGITRAQALSLCMKMTEDEVVIFRDLKDDDEKYDFLLMILGTM